MITSAPAGGWCLSAAWIAAALILTCLALPAPSHAAPDTVAGVVLDERGPVAGATVRVQTTPRSAVTDSDGRFVLSVADLGEEPSLLTAWASGYFCAGPVEARAGERDLELHLEAHPTEDNPDYRWVTSLRTPPSARDEGCATCHSRGGLDLPFTLPADEWKQDAHSQSARNPRFLSMYSGTALQGNRSPLTRRGQDRDYGTFPLPRDPAEPYYGPGYRLDFPDTAGICAACHTPAAAVDAPYSTDPTEVTGVAAEGVPCDFCHKVWGVRFDAATGLPRPNLPGVLALEFRRPPNGHQFFAGPLDDVAPGEDTFSPLQTESSFCASCHYGVFWDTVIYNSYGEWLESPYSDPDTGQTCQDCHMPRVGATHFVRPDKKGLARDPATIFSHRMPGASDERLLRDAISLAVTAEIEEELLTVEVSLTNEGAGHHIPTDSPLRHLILIARARDADGNPLAQSAGSRLPGWAGTGDPNQGHYAGLPGKAFAKVLEAMWTGVTPSAAYWNRTRVVSDNRIAALATDTSEYGFDAPGTGPFAVDVILLFRRAFIELMQQKGWRTPDVVMASQSLTIRGGEGRIP